MAELYTVHGGLGRSSIAKAEGYDRTEVFGKLRRVVGEKVKEMLGWQEL
jgi:hypothetical protein